MLNRQAYFDLFENRRILLHVRWGFSGLGLDRLCPIRLVACVDDSRTHDLITDETGIRFFALDRRTGRRSQGRDSSMNEILPAVRDRLEEALRECPGGRWVVFCPSPCRSAVEFAAEKSYDAACHSPELGHWLNDKSNFLAALGDLGLPRMRGRWVRLSEARYGELAAELGSSFVAQLARGTSGSGTAFVRSEDEYRAAGARFGNAPVWAVSDHGDLSLNINAVAMESGVAVSYPSVQLAGLSMLGARRGMYCGNDFAATADVPGTTLRDVVEQTETIGWWLASLGYRGYYGLDFVLDTGSSTAYAVDLNPRWQGSTVLLTQAEAGAGRLPLAFADLACRLGLMGEGEVLRARDKFLVPVAASQMSLRCPLAAWAEVTGDLEPGVFAFSQGLLRLRSGLRLEDLRTPDEMLVAAGLPRRAALMESGAHVLRASSTRKVVDIGRLAPLAWSEEAARSLYQSLALRPVEGG